MIAYIVRRLGQSVFVIIAVSLFVFLAVHLLPGDLDFAITPTSAQPQQTAQVLAITWRILPKLAWQRDLVCINATRGEHRLTLAQVGQSSR